MWAANASNVVEAVLAREDQLGVGLRQLRGADVGLGSGARSRGWNSRTRRIAFALAGREHAEHAGRAVAVILQIGLERLAQLASCPAAPRYAP